MAPMGLLRSAAVPRSLLASTFVLASLSLGASLAACSSSGTDGSPVTADGGTTTADGGVVANGEGGAAGSDSGISVTAPDGAVASTPGAPSLGGQDGITGTFKGATHAHTASPLHVPQQTPTVLIGANGPTTPLPDSWALRFLPQVGTQTCNGASGPSDPAVSYRSITKPDLAGTTGATGACSITVTSVSPKYEGSFTATIPTGGGSLVVTDGYFRIAN